MARSAHTITSTRQRDGADEFAQADWHGGAVQRRQWAVARAGGSTIWSARPPTSDRTSDRVSDRDGQPTSYRTRAIRLWLYAVAALVLAMVLVGGATRLTKSGLSITEWQPVMGTLPPLSDDAMAGRIREISGHPAIPRAQSRHEPRCVQDHLLVGMDASAHRPHHRRRVPAAAAVVPVARLDRRRDCARGSG